MAEPFRPRRSALFLPASNPRAIEKARASDADVVILDLEDAVAPEVKAAAREAAVTVARVDWGGRELVVRVNALNSEWGAADCAAMADARIDAVLAPKVGTPSDVARYAAAIGERPLWIMIETCLAIGNLRALADNAADSRLTAFVIGTNDLALEMRARPGPDRAELIPLLALTVTAARSRGLTVLDGVCNDFRDKAQLAVECAQGRALGFDGKTLIHPAQIAACNAAFSPSEEEVAEAKAIVAAYDVPEAAGRGAIQVGGRMIERLHLAQAERVLAISRNTRSS